jgi:hypothetical protein
MKTEKELQFRLNTLEGLLERAEREYDALSSVKRASVDGKMKVDVMNQLTGQITGLNWMKESSILV